VTKILYNVDSKGKTRYVTFHTATRLLGGYEIKRDSGLVGGTNVSQPTITIDKGKAKRTLEQQVQLEFDSLVNKARDKGYKDTVEELTTYKTDANGNKKPQLAKDPRGKLPHTITEEEAREVILSRIQKIIKGKKGYISKKLDGVRMLQGMKSNKINSTSRSGKSYNPITKEIVKDPCIREFFDKYPNYQLDGELYVHGVLLEELSGDARKHEWIESRHAKLQYWIFDIVAEGLTFEERLEILKTIQPKTEKVVIVEHVAVTDNIDIIMAYYDKWIEEGYEGGIWREASSLYKEGKDNRMIKIKLMQDDEFEITGIAEGLRPEDMVFEMKTADGVAFEAKPKGTVEQRLWYLANIKDLIGKFGTVKFFHYSVSGAPNLPSFKSLREDGE